MSKLADKLNGRQFVFTSEISPPKGTAIDECMRAAELLRDVVSAVNVTDNQSSVMRAGSLSISAKLVERGFEPVFQLACRDRNRIALQSDLLGAWIQGIENVLCLTGDHTVLGDHSEAMPVFDLDSVQLISAVRMLNQGKDLAGHQLDGKTNFYCGAVVAPDADPLEPQLIKMEKKVRAGARFFQTQAVFDVEHFVSFTKKIAHLDVPLVAGIVLLKSANMARYMNSNVAGIKVPQTMIDELDATPKDRLKGKGLEIAVRTVKDLKSVCQGVHIMPLGWDDLVPRIIEIVSGK